MDEQKLVKLYMELTGTAESAARSVVMYVSLPNGEKGDLEPARASGTDTSKAIASSKSPVPALQGAAALLLILGWLGLSPIPARAAGASSATNTLPTTPLSLADAVNIALQQNPTILKAQKDLEAAQGVVIQTRAIAMPTATLGGSYGAVQQTDINTLNFGSATFGTPQNWTTQFKVVQSFYQGGRILSAFRVADLTQQRSLLDYQTAMADAVLTVQLSYYGVLLAVQQITVEEASVDLLTRELTDTTRRYDAGTVPRFNVLRAEVELGNERPKLISARNRLRVSKNTLANLLGVNVPSGTLEDIPLVLSGKLEAEPYDLELTRAIATAFERRPELKSLQRTQALRKEDIVNAKAGYKPVLQGYAGYDIHNSSLSSDLSVENHGWIVGAQAAWNIFDGLHTKGKVLEATAGFERAGVEVDDGLRRIELEVRTSYSNFIEAREVLESQKKVQEQAEEALRLASARYDAGSGTQLDVLSAQTALTQARTTQIQSLHDYAAARARLQRAVGMILPTEPVQR